MNLFIIGLIVLQVSSLARGTCVLESDFGFILNCNFKKSGLFRVRNLGGLKAHFGLGFSLGDELGFAESIGNLEGGRRRALSYKTGYPGNVGVLPSSKLPAVPNDEVVSGKSIKKNVPLSISSRAKQNSINRLPVGMGYPHKIQRSPLMTGAASLPLGVPAFRPIPKPVDKFKPVPTQKHTVMIQSNTAQMTLNNKVMEPTPFRPQNSYEQQQQDKNQTKTFHQMPQFHAMPNSPVSRISTGNVVEIDSNRFEYFEPQDNTIPKVDLMGHTVEELAAAANVSVTAIKHAIFMREQQLLAEQRAAQAAQLRAQFMGTSTKMTPTKTTTTTERPTTTKPSPVPTPTMKSTASTSKVMNAPKEYYPVGYEKNFDDNFKSKVDLPTTSFACGNQKHFPGLYADTDLGCMVFHVCALTDEGLLMKSFLCPESTLFDQTILKCNWWFYVDCPNSKGLYDSNIPISKSYQLMKSLTYFSNYNKNNDSKEGIDIEALKNTVSANSETPP